MFWAVFAALVSLQVAQAHAHETQIDESKDSLPSWIEGVWVAKQVEVKVQGEPASIAVAKARFFVFHNNRMLSVHATSQYSKKLLATTYRGDTAFLLFKRPKDLPTMKFVAKVVADGVELTSETRLTDNKKLKVKYTLTRAPRAQAKERLSDEIEWDFSDLAWFPEADRKQFETWLGASLPDTAAQK